MRGVLARWERSGLSLREFGQQRGIPLTTLTWWRQVFRRAGEPVNAAAESDSAGDAVVFTEVHRRRDRVKLLVWERDGFWLLYKRLETGTFAVLDRDEINARELYLLLEGIEVVRQRVRYERPHVVTR